MIKKRVLVTGGNGFIGLNLISRLVQMGMDVHCLVRPSSDTKTLIQRGVGLITGELTGDLTGIGLGTDPYDWVIHLAGSTNIPNRDEKIRVNVGGTRNLLQALSGTPNHPIFVFISSLAAAGPSSPHNSLTETSPCQPVSDYGYSKLQTEQVAREFASQIPISIVRPPIVLGPHDREGLILFKLIQQSGIHFVASYSTHFFSVIHVEDLIESIITVAEKGERVSSTSLSQGIYFATSDEAPSYCELGKMIGRAVGQTRVWCVPTPKLSIFATGVINSGINRFLGQRYFLNLDKAKEAVAGSWKCSNAKLKELGWQIPRPLQIRLNQTAAWYRQQGHLQ